MRIIFVENEWEGKVRLGMDCSMIVMDADEVYVFESILDGLIDLYTDEDGRDGFYFYLLQCKDRINAMRVQH